MKNQKKCRKGIYRLALLLTVLCSAVGGYAQTQDDLKLVDPGGFKLCNGDAVNGQKLTVYNQCVHEGFKKGTFKVDWGDGSAVEEWGTEETMEHVYREFKVFKLKFSWTSSDGSKVLEKNYDVLRLNKPDVALKVNEKGTCYGMESEIKIIDYDKQTSGTVYVVNFGDGRDTTLTQAEMMKTMGSVKHTFQTDNCPITVELEARNECSDYMLPLQTTVTTAVVIPPEAAFDFVAPGCTGYPVQVINRTIEGRDVYCNTIAEYIWKFGDKPSVFEKYPQVIFDTPGEYEVRLIASTGGLECSNDTIVKVISVIQSPEVGFTVDRDTVCSGESVVFTDHSKGENPQYYWNVTGRQTNDFVFINGTSEKSENPVIQFNGYGEYVVALTLTNECPQNVKDTTIIVRKDPEIVEVTWPVSLCPDLTTGKALVNLENYFRLYWNGNPKEAVWKIEPKAGMTGTVDFLPGYEADKEYPQVYLQAGATYEVSLTLKGASVGGVLCGDPSKLTIHKELKIDDPAITDNIVPTPAPVGDNISICDGETVSFENHSNGEGLEHSWTIKPITTELYDPAWNVEYLAGSPTSAEPRIRFNGYGDFEVTDSLSVPCNSKRISFRVHVRKDPTIFLADFPTEICPRDVLNTELCIFYEWYNHVPEAHWEFTPDRVDFVDGTSSDSPEPKIHFQESGKYTYKVTLPEVGCPEKDEHGGILTRKELTGELKVRISGLDVTVKEKDNRDEVCEGGMLIFTNSASEKDPESLELAYNWEVTIPETGEPQGGTAEDCEFLKGNTEKVAPITFKKWGTYEVTGTVFGFCDTVSRTLRIRVKKNPEVVLEDTVSCPAGFVLSGDTTFVWYNNTPQVTWQIYRQDGTDQPGDYELGAEGLTSLIPRVEFKRPGYYTVKATLPHAGCPATDPVAEAVYHIYDPDIYGDIVIKTPVAGNPSVADICEQEIVVFENTMQEEAGALSWEWEVVSDVEQGYEYMQDGQVIDPAVGSRQKAPSIRFTKYGEYRVRVATHSTCKSPVTKEFRVVVHGIPDIELASYMKRVCAGDGIPVEMSDYLKWVDTRNSALTSKWTITPEVGWSWKGGDRENTDFPGILFNDNGHYELKLEVFSKCADEGKQEFLTEVNVLRTEQQASFSVGKDSVGCTDDPDPFVITLNNLSEGDSLAYTWTVTPQQGVSFAEGDTNSESPKLLFSEPGDYDVRLAVSNGCHHDDDSVFRIKAFAIPRVRIGDIADQCEPFHFIGRERVEVDQRNDKIQQVHWTITANQGYASEGYTLVNGTDLKSYYPDIDFKTCDYTVVAAYKNRCKTPGQAVFQVKVDKFIPVIPLPDDTICELAEARILRAQPEGGWWTLKDPAIPEAAEVLYTERGNSYFYPGFDPYAQKDIGLV
nr:PKD domain-containing protein [Odoribacter sp.]